MAKERMICPFSNRLCEECALYRGRHYYLCFYQKYRGYLNRPGGFARENLGSVPGTRLNGKFEIPIIRTRAKDPFVTNHENNKKET
jgi:hypothetical protein